MISSDNSFNDISFKKFIKEKEKQIHTKTEDGIQDTDSFKNLHRSLISYHQKNNINGYTAILISEDDLNNLTDEYVSKLSNLLGSHDYIVNDHILIDRNLDIQQSTIHKLVDNNEARKYYLNLSNDYCVFLINPKDVHYFVNGKDVGETIFFTQDTLDSYEELYEINDLLKLFEMYRDNLKIRDVYSKFFVPKTSKASLLKHLNNKYTKEELKEFLESNKYLLHNKPEDKFREDLRFFLDKKLKANLLSKEHILENFKRLDIFITDPYGELYFIEVKWVGTSIHQNGDRIGTSYSSNNINPAAILQSVGYIKQLNDEGKKIKLGYLAVFDAREQIDIPDTCHNYDKNQIPKELRSSHSIFHKIPDFKVKNIHPA